LSKKTAKTICAIAMAVAACTGLYAVLNGMNPLPAIGMLLCTVVIFLANLVVDKDK
jgi:hypothetical protein